MDQRCVQAYSALPAAKQLQIPIITLTKESLKPSSESWISTCKSVREAMEGFSSFVAVYDDGLLGPQFMASVFSTLKELFILPKETKSLNTSEIPGFGYFGETHGSLNETFGIGDSTTVEAVQSFTNLMWPLGNHHFCEKIHSYATEVSKLAQTVTTMIFESYGVGNKHCDAHIDSISYLLRPNSYRVPQTNETNEGVSAHADTSFISIIQEDEVGGLEVQYSKDGSWIPVTLPPSSFAIVAGDALLAWSNGKIRPCVHRVIMGERARMSVGLFAYHEGIIQVPEEIADGKGSLQFNSFDHLGLLKFRRRNPTLSPEERVRTFCGVQEHL